MIFVRRRLLALIVLLIAVSLLMGGCSAKPAGQQDRSTQVSGQTLKVQTIDIGQGDAILIQAQGQVVLVDTGDVPAREKLVRYIKSQGITTIDKVFITHPHADHLGGMAAVLENFKVKQIYDSGLTTTTALYRQYLTTVQKKNIPFEVVAQGSTIDLGGGAVLKVLAPQKPFITQSELNNNSIVLKLTYGKFSMMLTGDAEKEAEDKLIKDYAGELKSSVLKSGHHGSNTSSTTAFLKAVAPEAIIISVGANNDYHHPHPSTMKKYAELKAKVYQTDRDGTLTITSDGQTYNINKEK